MNVKYRLPAQVIYILYVSLSTYAVWHRYALYFDQIMSGLTQPTLQPKRVPTRIVTA